MNEDEPGHDAVADPPVVAATTVNVKLPPCELGGAVHQWPSAEVNCEMKVMKEAGRKDGLADVSYHENPRKGVPQTEVKGEGLQSKRGDVRAVGGLKVEMGLGVLAVGCGGRKDADGDASVYEEGEKISAIVDMLVDRPGATCRRQCLAWWE